MADIVTLQEVYNLTDFATDNLWQLDFISMPVTGYSITSAELNMRCQSFTVPLSKVKKLSVTLHNHVKQQSTVTEQPQTITIPFIETQDMRTTRFFKAWRDVCSRPNDNYVSLPSQRRATIQFYHYTPQKDIIYTYRICYCEVNSIGDVTYNDGSNPGAIIKNVELSCGAVYEMD